jgi:high-affinity nickel permease
LRSIHLAFQRVRHGERYVEEDFDLLLNSRGFLSRLFRPMFALGSPKLAHVPQVVPAIAAFINSSDPRCKVH